MKNKNVLLLLLLLCHNIIHSQQVDINSAHYIGNANFTLFEDVFNTSGRTWDANSYIESEGNWRAHFERSITHGANEHQAYQRSQAVFDENNEMLLLIADYVSDTDLECDDLEHPNGTTCKIDSSYSIRYLSGAIQSIDPSFLYGYFEIRCKLPVHQGAFPAFWLFSACNKSDCEDPYYEELDIFEYSWRFTDSVKYDKTEALYVGDNRCFTSGLYINDTGNAVSWRDAFARIYPRISDDKPGVEQWNTWGCLWMPDKVEWYLNGKLFNSLYDSEKIPHHPLYLMANYAVDCYAVDTIVGAETNMFYQINDTMYIDYIRVYQPKWDTALVMIDEQYDMDNYVHGIKSSVTINSIDNTPIIVRPDKKIDIMASESVYITAPFQVDEGANFSITIQENP